MSAPAVPDARGRFGPYGGRYVPEVLIAARGELDETKRKAMYSELANILRDEGGLILPMFNNFIDAHRDTVQGWVRDPNHETSNLRAAIRVWLSPS